MGYDKIRGSLIFQRDVRAIGEFLINDWNDEQNKICLEFERAFAKHLGRKYAVCTINKTAAMHLALYATGIGENNEVIIPDLTPITSFAPIVYCNAIPVVTDIIYGTLCLCHTKFEEAITKDTKAVIGSDLYGCMPEWDKILEIAQAENLTVIEDVMTSFGSVYENMKAGSIGHVSVFNLDHNCAITADGAGMLTTDNTEIYERAIEYRNHGMNPAVKENIINTVACDYKPSKLQCCLGLSQLKNSKELLNKQSIIYKWYQQRLDKVAGMSLTPDIGPVIESYPEIALTIDSKMFGSDCVRIRQILDTKGVSTATFIRPVSRNPAVSQLLINNKTVLKPAPIAKQLSDNSYIIPSSLELNEDDVDNIAKIITETMYENRN